MSWVHQVTAFNTAARSSNRMHDDEVAASYGFDGGLVPGVDVWAYLVRPCVERWDKAFLEHGTMDVRFVEPVYDGERVTARLEGDGSLAITGDRGRVRAEGTAGLADPGDRPEVRKVAAAAVPDPAPAAEADELRPGTVLATLRFTHRRQQAVEYLDSIRETSPIFESGLVGHPGTLARQANHVLSHSVRLGPWIHVGTRSWNRGLVHEGDAVETRAVVTDEYEHKGHRFVAFDVEATANESPVWSARHTAIWRPRDAA